MNYSFEALNNCPPSYSNPSIDYLPYASPWHRPSDGTSDLFNLCSNINPQPNAGVSVNFHGDQFAATGIGYVGFFAATSGVATYREYVEGQLSSTLIAGTKYLIRFKLSLADCSNQATDDLGIAFCNFDYTFSGAAPPPFNRP